MPNQVTSLVAEGSNAASHICAATFVPAKGASLSAACRKSDTWGCYTHGISPRGVTQYKNVNTVGM